MDAKRFVILRGCHMDPATNSRGIHASDSERFQRTGSSDFTGIHLTDGYEDPILISM